MEEKLMAITLEELAKEVQKLKDMEEIKVLKARYSDMCDSNHDWTQIKDLFAPDAKWIGDPTQPWGGGNNREEIEKLFADDAVLGNTVYVIYDRPDCLHDLPPSEYGSEPSEQH